MEEKTRLAEALSDRYRIEREIGSGGMATVYLAEDLKHNRQVALKVLKPELAAVLGAERFLSEIQTTAHLQHPNILPLFDSGEADGQLFYVMPYVEGESLRDRLSREKQLPVEDAVRIATEVAEALQAAHDDGIIHRDIKPANILLRKGKPVVADFGIALAVSAAGGLRLTETGLSLGTPYYMSPEQASADRDPDARSDVYSLGCVLYEMLTGEPPFTGSTAQAVLARILTGEVVPPTERRKAVPPNVEAALLQAVEKLPADRFPTAREFARALADPGFRHGAGVAAMAAAPPGPWKPIAVGASALAVLLALSVAWLTTRPQPAGPVLEFLLDPDEAPFSYATILTRDGSGMIFVAPGEDGSNQLWIRRWEDRSPVPIPGTTGAVLWSLSPDAREVAYTTQDNRLWVTPMQGGVQDLRSESGYDEPQWGSDGFIYFTNRSGGLSRVRAEGDTVTESLTDATSFSETHYMKDVHPDLDLGIIQVVAEGHWLEALRLSTGERKQLTIGERGFLTASGHLVFATSDGMLMAAPFDVDSMELDPSRVRVEEGIYTDPEKDPYFSLSETGSLLYWTGAPFTDEYELAWADSSGVSPVVPDWTFKTDSTLYGPSFALSPDGRFVAWSEMTDLGTGIWVRGLPAGAPRPLTFHEAREQSPQWRPPDGQEITFLSDRLGNWDVWTRNADGTGEAELLVDYEEPITDFGWSPDGRWLALRTAEGQEKGGRNILRFQPGVDSIPQPLVVTPDDEFQPAISPDGDWVAYASTESGRSEVYLQPFPFPDQTKVKVSEAGGMTPVWARDGRALYYYRYDRNPLASRDLWVGSIDPGPPPSITDRRVLFTLPEGIYYWYYSNRFEVVQDGQRFLMARAVNPSDADPKLVLVTNWVERMKERVEG